MSYVEYVHDIVKLVDVLLQNAIERSVSDIHLEPSMHGLRVRFRIDGFLQDQEIIAQQAAEQACARVQVLAHIDGSQQRIPHDGTFAMTYNMKPIDIRVSTFPSLYGPKMVLRILDREKNAIAIEQLGMSSVIIEQFKLLMKKSSGFIVTSGPTGSGKTTTLYAALSSLHAPHTHIITLEDPVEYHIPGITQGHIYPAAGFTFEKGIRALLRHDPDVVMIGEIRDAQTAHIAMQAALTGHLVFSTIHTNDAVSVMVRLFDMGIERFLMNAALTGIIAQRLVRKLCVYCKKKCNIQDEEIKLMKLLAKKYQKKESEFASVVSSKGEGCEQCNATGYKGRIGIFELLEIAPTMRSLIMAEADTNALYEQALADGMHTMYDDGLSKVCAGETTITELARVLL